MDTVAKDIVNFDETERILSTILDLSDETIVDFSNSVWVTPLSVCTLNSAFEERKEKGYKTIIKLPEAKSQANRLLENKKVTHYWHKYAVEVSSDSRHLYSEFEDTNKAVAFEHFTSRDEFERYLTRLKEEDLSQHLLGTKTTPNALKSSTFRYVFLKELVGNTFDHAEGKLSQFSITEFPAAQRKDHPLFPGFKGKGYMEICVGDFGDKNIIDTIIDYLPEEYSIPNTSAFNIPEEVRAVYYAFDFGSTSNPEKREQELESFFDGDDLDASRIATGLHNIKAVANAYGGHIIIRTSHIIVSLDFTKGTLKVNYRENLTPITGTILCLRMPVEKLGKATLVPPLNISKKIQHRSIENIGIIPIFRPNEGKFTHKTFESMLDGINKAARDLKKYSKNCICLYLGNFGLDTKVFGGILQLILNLSREYGFVVIVEDSQYAFLAKEQWEETSKTDDTFKEEFRNQSFVVVSAAENLAIDYGYPYGDRGTHVDGNSIIIPNGSSFDYTELINECRSKFLEFSLKNKPIFRSKGLFLIENSYYTQKFYEIKRLLEQQSTEIASRNWFLTHFYKQNPKVITVNTPYLYDFVINTLSSLGHNTPAVHLLDKNKIPTLALNVNRELKANDRIMMLTDVVCKGRSIQKFLKLFPNPENAVVLCFVNSTNTGVDYINIPKNTGSKDVQILYMHKDDLGILNTRPPHSRAEDIYIVDRLTNSPTQYFQHSKHVGDDRITYLDDNIFIDHCIDHDSLFGGHFSLNKKHFSYFLAFSRLFNGCFKDIYSWLNECANEFRLETEQKQDNILEKVNIFCVDEETGLFDIAEKYSRENGYLAPEKLTKEQLYAPPPDNDDPDDKYYWFIVPAMASGQTIRWCMDYMGANDNGIVVISVVVSRTTPRHMTFYHKLNSYENARCRIQFFGNLPLESYEKNNCPTCGLIHKQQHVLEKLGNNSLVIRGILEDSVRMLKQVHVQNAGMSDAASIDSDDFNAEVILSSLFFNAMTSPDKIDSLNELISEPGAIGRLGRSVGRGLPDSINLKNFRSFLDPSYVELLQKWIDGDWANEQEVLLELRGLLKLFPDELIPQLPRMLVQHSDKPPFVKAVIAEALMDPKKMWDVLLEKPENLNNELKQAFLEATRYAENIHLSENMLLFWKLKEHLARSDDWQSAMRYIEGIVSKKSSQNFSDVFYRFKNIGFAEVSNCVRKLKQTSVWRHLNIQTTGSLDKKWTQIEKCVHDLEECNDLFELNLETLSKFKDNLDRAYQSFLTEMGKLAFRPGNARKVTKELQQTLEIEDVTVKVSFTNDCHSLAITDDDLRDVLYYLLENVKKYTSKDNEVELHFRSYSESHVLLEFKQTEPWTVIRTGGGTSTIDKILTPYGGRIQLVPDTKPPGPFVNILLPSWRS
ncbi:MAG: hypothetical protein HWE34_02080 [Methylocystaceae bacterium]|nr:hypothetical protein [Methylocystaceae bacterium]